MKADKYPIKDEWTDYYKYLERLRKSGVTNMFCAAPWLESRFSIEKNLAYEILANWIHNYDQLSEIYKWRI